MLYLLGQVSQKTMHKFQKESQEIGKGSFSFAWVLDEHAEERERGVTINVGVTTCETDKKKITLLDAPGHRDFIPNMISGTAQADVAILVISTKRGEFEAGIADHGQTREHILLARTLGVTQLIVAVNKMDTVDWAQERFEEIKKSASQFLHQHAGFPRSAVLAFVPCSGLGGINILPSSAAHTTLPAELSRWYSGPSLIDAIDSFKPIKRAMDKPFRLCVTDVYKSQMQGVAVGGKIESGIVAVGDQLLVMPSEELIAVKSVLFHHQTVNWSVAGDNVDLGIVQKGVDTASLRLGDVLCDPEHPIVATTRFRAQVIVFFPPTPITKGYQAVLYTQSTSEPAVISRLVSVLDKTSGAVLKKHPRCLDNQVTAVVEITTQRPVCLELYKDYRRLGSITLRDQGSTIAAGIVVQLIRKK